MSPVLPVVLAVVAFPFAFFTSRLPRHIQLAAGLALAVALVILAMQNTDGPRWLLLGLASMVVIRTAYRFVARSR